jgi:hypothetical protein
MMIGAAPILIFIVYVSLALVEAQYAYELSLFWMNLHIGWIWLGLIPVGCIGVMRTDNFTDIKFFLTFIYVSVFFPLAVIMILLLSCGAGTCL